MFPYLLLLFTVVPAVELAILIEVGTHIGAGNTILLIIVTGILGASLARYQGFVVLNQIQQNLNKGNMPSEQLMDGLMILVGGIVLLTPGFITDTIGFLLMIPLSRTLIKLWVKKRFEHMIANGQIVTMHNQRPRSQNDRYDDIDI